MSHGPSRSGIDFPSDERKKSRDGNPLRSFFVPSSSRMYVVKDDGGDN